MAFNPLNTFQKHQKAWMAGIIIVCMVVFMFQFGAGDPFGRGLTWFGGFGQRGTPVATIHGKRLYLNDLHQLREDRRVASDFLVYLSVLAQSKVILDLEKKYADEKEEGSALGPLVKQHKDREEVLRRQPLSPRGVEKFREDIAKSTTTILNLASLPVYKDSDDKMRELEQVAVLLGTQDWLLSTYGQHPRPMYFGGTGKVEDHLDFLVWKHQADKLGIVLSEADVRRELTRESAFNELIGKSFTRDTEEVARFLGQRDNRGITPDGLLEALKDEFRVVIAQGSVLGTEPGVRAYRSLLGASDSPAVFAPRDFLGFVREERTALDVKFLRIPVGPLLKAVTEKPKDAALKARYDEYKDQFPDPTRRTPGFKEPRRVQFEYVRASPRDPYYRNKAREDVATVGKIYGRSPAAVAATRAADLFGITTPGASFMGRMAQMAAALNDPLGGPYMVYSKMTPAWLAPDAPGYARTTPTFLHDGSTHYARHTTALLGQLTGASLGTVNPFAAASTWYGSGTVFEVRDAARFAGSYLMMEAGHAPHLPALGTLMNSFAMAASLAPWSPSQQEVQPFLEWELSLRLAADMLQGNLTTMRTEIAKHKREPDKANAFIARAVKDYHLRHDLQAQPLSEPYLVEALRLGTDPRLLPLREAYRLMHQAPPLLQMDAMSQLRRALSQRNLDDALMVRDLLGLSNEVYDPRQVVQIFFGPNPQPIPLFHPLTQELFLVWKAIDVLPSGTRDYHSDDKLRQEVVDAWKLEVARSLAWRQAEAVVTEVKGAGRLPVPRLERLLQAEAKKGPGRSVFDLTGVARLVRPSKEVLAFQRTEYRPYLVPVSQVADFPYPPEGLAALQKLKEGETTILSDRPGRNLYVAVVTARNEPTLKDFEELYVRSPGLDTLLDRFLSDNIQKFRKDILAQLRREASPKGGLKTDGEWEVSDDTRSRLEGRGSGEGPGD